MATELPAIPGKPTTTPQADRKSRPYYTRRFAQRAANAGWRGGRRI